MLLVEKADEDVAGGAMKWVCRVIGHSFPATSIIGVKLKSVCGRCGVGYRAAVWDR